MRKKENIKEEENSPTIDKYLTDTIEHVKTKVKKSDIEQDKKKCILYCIPAIRNYGLHADARDGVLKFLEDILGEAVDLHKKDCFNKIYSLLGNYEFFDAHEGEASECKKKVQEIMIKYFPDSVHSIGNVSHFRESMEGFY